jgi:hypothetical protein
VDGRESAHAYMRVMYGPTSAALDARMEGVPIGGRDKRFTIGTIG